MKILLLFMGFILQNSQHFFKSSKTFMHLVNWMALMFDFSGTSDAHICFAWLCLFAHYQALCRNSLSLLQNCDAEGYSKYREILTIENNSYIWFFSPSFVFANAPLHLTNVYQDKSEEPQVTTFVRLFVREYQ